MTFDCEDCNYHTNYKHNYKKHMSTKKHMKNLNNSIKYECKECEYETPVHSNYKRHMSGERHVNDAKKEFTCEECEYSTHIACNYQKHLTTKKHRDTERRAEVINNITNNNITNNNNTVNNDNRILNDNRTINISINFYGNEKLGELDFDTMQKIQDVKNNPHKIIDILLNKYFIEEEENRNVTYTSLKSKRCKVLVDTDDYKTMMMDDVFRHRINKITDRQFLCKLSRMYAAPVSGVGAALYHPKKYLNMTEYKHEMKPDIDDPNYKERTEAYVEGLIEMQKTAITKDRHFSDIYDTCKKEEL